MATCLQCDNCNAVVGERDNALRMWWRLERYGLGWVEEPKRVPRAVPAFIQTMIMGEIDFDEEDDVEPDELIDEMAEEPSDVSLHFCSAKCLGEWAQQAEALEA